MKARSFVFHTSFAASRLAPAGRRMTPDPAIATPADMIDGIGNARHTQGRLHTHEPKWIVADDNPEMLAVIAEVLRQRLGARVIECATGADALRMSREGTVECIVTDRDMPGMNGLELAREVHARAPHIPIVLVTGRTEGLDARSLRAHGVRAILPKPFSCETFVSTIQALRVNQAHATASVSMA